MMSPENARDWLNTVLQHVAGFSWCPVFVIVGGVLVLVFRSTVSEFFRTITRRIGEGAEFEGAAGPVKLKVGERPPAPIPQEMPVLGEADLVPRQVFEQAQADARSWHFAYLDVVLEPRALLVLQWMSDQRSPVSADRIWAVWDKAVPTEEEREASLAHLQVTNFLPEMPRTVSGSLSAETASSTGLIVEGLNLNQSTTTTRSSRHTDQTFQSTP